MVWFVDIDSSGKTITSTYYFIFDRYKKYSDFIELACYDWNEELNQGTDHLKVAVNSKEFDQWLIEEAFK